MKFIRDIISEKRAQAVRGPQDDASRDLPTYILQHDEGLAGIQAARSALDAGAGRAFEMLEDDEPSTVGGTSMLNDPALFDVLNPSDEAAMDAADDDAPQDDAEYDEYDADEADDDAAPDADDADSGDDAAEYAAAADHDAAEDWVADDDDIAEIDDDVAADADAFTFEAAAETETEPRDRAITPAADFGPFTEVPKSADTSVRAPETEATPRPGPFATAPGSSIADRDGDAPEAPAPSREMNGWTGAMPRRTPESAPAPAAEKMPEMPRTMRAQQPVEPQASAEQAVDVPAPAAGRSGRRAGRVKTRLLGFNTAQSGASDPFAEKADQDTAEFTEFPTGWLIVVDGPGRGSAFTLFNGVAQIGRGSDQAVRLDFGDNSISRENHAAIAYDAEQHKFYLGHGGKANLVRLNNRPVLSTEELETGHLIRIGETTLRFVALCGPEFDWSGSEEGSLKHVSFG